MRKYSKKNAPNTGICVSGANLARADQDEMEKELIQQLNDSIETELKKETTDTTMLKIIEDKIKAVTGVQIQ